VTLIRSYVVGSGITLSSTLPEVDRFIAAFWSHPQNHIDQRLAPLCDELTRTGEAFPVLFTIPATGMSFVRFVPACQIREIQTDPQDYETELSYTQLTAAGRPVTWTGPGSPAAFTPSETGALPPLLLHFAVNRPIGATRGESDLTPILPWARRYSEWLKDRVRLNRQRTRFGLLDLEIADDTMVQQKKQQLAAHNPIEAGIYVHGPGETTTLHDLNINANAAEKDGQILRLAIATGANAALHYLGEGEAVNYATAKEMGEPTSRFFSERQEQISAFLITLAATAWRRREAVLHTDPIPDPLITAHAAEVARADNESLAKAAKSAVEALATMRDYGWTDDPTAIQLAFKFAGETLSEDQIQSILNAPPTTQGDPQL